ncbi:MAG TPA: ATP-binding protein, partial [Pirellulaceae bacterium]|nr:ATP-binding protein [Pirellulaceae bacterium]
MKIGEPAIAVAIVQHVACQPAVFLRFRLTGATLDRLTHRCHILEATGESYRLKDARRRQAQKSSQSRAKKSGA